MTKELAEVLVQIDDPDTIEQVLEAARIEETPENGLSPLKQPTLSEQFDRYLSRRKNRSPATRGQYHRTIPDFIDFSEDHGVTHPAGISVKLVEGYIDKLELEYDLDATILTHTKNVRAWLRWLARRNYCEEGVYRLLDKKELGLSLKARDETIPEETAAASIQRLRQRRRGSSMHSLMELGWNGGPRIGDIHSADLQDFDPDNNTLRFRHRPETGTRLKNGSEDDDTPGDGERDIVIKDCTVEAIQLYIDTERPDVTDDYGRRPLFATSYGRASRSTLRRWIYEATSCHWAPETSDGPTCDGSCDPDSNVCPQSYYPHAIRRGAIVNQLSGGLRRDLASDRFNVSENVLRKHYDTRSKQQKKEDRSEAVRKSWPDW
ncbi:site-specific integrase [Natrinema hispanicum]|uniref:Site-specific recombinase XerD n=1 Tax=Natrinema hispanicum TaxID=392421 RepID=A0A1I0FBV8_9EURY|nr:site-specific integrase [Natrinema hispanicum]SET54674.1 Site-specific recombinase XerD [Natrinema hispanicum]